VVVVVGFLFGLMAGTGRRTEQVNIICPSFFWLWVGWQVDGWMGQMPGSG
jgi:hypothetical protein